MGTYEDTGALEESVSLLLTKSEKNLVSCVLENPISETHCNTSRNSRAEFSAWLIYLYSSFFLLKTWIGRRFGKDWQEERETVPSHLCS